MPTGQQFLFAPEKPLVQRLGKKFFRKLPRKAGVYKMRDAQDNIVYVGKAKDLRQRLSSYRVANPERLGRRHLRLLQSVARIDVELCSNETAALKHEAKLIRELKPKFNRAGVWQGKPQFLVWRFDGSVILFAVRETPPNGWERVGSFGSYAPRLRATLVRLLWLVLNPQKAFHQLPHGWMQNQMPDTVTISCPESASEIRAMLGEAFWGSSTVFLNWLTLRLDTERPTFERNAIAKDLQDLTEFFTQQNQRPEKRAPQLALL
jgi:predicted GIY-YIG superfamily endonuclease